ncbi:MAG: hypothetical protein ACFFG0_08040 [Candidatus Thorarchaeota archaeon]
MSEDLFDEYGLLKDNIEKQFQSKIENGEILENKDAFLVILNEIVDNASNGNYSTQTFWKRSHWILEHYNILISDKKMNINLISDYMFRCGNCIHYYCDNEDLCNFHGELKMKECKEFKSWKKVMKEHLENLYYLGSSKKELLEELMKIIKIVED